MTNDQIFLNGAPIVGFGDAGTSTANPINRPLVGFLVGTTGGAIIGAIVGKGVGAAVGAVAGGLGGAIVGGATASAAPAAAQPSPSPWQRITTLSGLKAGQQLAIAMLGPNGAPLPPADIAQMHTLLVTLPTSPANLPAGNFVEYPPGSQLPPDWPKDDDLGAGAYRVTEDMFTDAPPQAAAVKLPPPSVGVVKMWARSKPAAATGIGNPAAKNCVDKGGTVKIIETPAGQSGVCVFPDGSRCEEWRFFSGQCAPGQCRTESGKC